MGVLGLLFAWLDPNVVSLTELTFRIFIPATFIPTLAAFYWKRATAVGALLSSVVGVAASVMWHLLVLPTLTTPLDSWFEPAFIGVAVSFVVLVVASFLSKPSPAEKWQQFMPQRSRM
jgi:SSS family solute:Na+ symporter